MTKPIIIPTMLRLVADHIEDKFPLQAADLRMAASDVQSLTRFADEIVSEAQEDAAIADAQSKLGNQLYLARRESEKTVRRLDRAEAAQSQLIMVSDTMTMAELIERVRPWR